MAEATAGRQQQEGQGKLQAGLKRRHMTMISLGGIIGAGLFVGTGPILNQAGPATILTYLLTGTLLALVHGLWRHVMHRPGWQPWAPTLTLGTFIAAAAMA